MNKLTIAYATFFVVLLATAALGHSWYPSECCSDVDCRIVPCEEILETATGWVYDGINYTKEQMRLSQDADCHACYNQLSRVGLCLFGRFGV